MAASHTTDHVTAAIGRLRQQYKDKPNIEAWVRILTEPVQRLEGALWQLLTERGIDEAVGAQLDRLGAIVGQPRNGRLDDTYRRFIRARISVHKSTGTVEDVLTVTRLVLNLSSATLGLADSGPATVVETIGAVELTDDLASLLVVYFLRDTVAAGVRLILEYFLADGADQFYWDTGTWDSGKVWGSAID